MRTPLLVTLARAIAIGVIGTLGTFSLAAVLAPAHAAALDAVPAPAPAHACTHACTHASDTDPVSGAGQASPGLAEPFDPVLPHVPREPSSPVPHPVMPWTAEPAPSCALPSAAAGRPAATEA